MPKYFQWGFVVLIMILIGGLVFFLGVYVGRLRAPQSIGEQAEKKIIEQIAGKLKTLPSINLLAPSSDNILSGAISAKNNNELTLTADPSSIEELLSDQRITYKLLLNEQTEIYYLEIKNEPAGAGEVKLSDIFVKHSLKSAELKIGDRVAVVIDAGQKSASSVNALEIKVNR